MARANRTEFKLTGDWRKLGALLNAPRFRDRLERNMLNATKQAGMVVVAEIRRRIRARRYAPNNPFTVLMKRSSGALVDDGDLFAAVTSVAVNPNTVFVGILRNTVSEDGNLANLAELLHEGGNVTVTTAMRNLFLVLARVGAGQMKKSKLSGRAAEIAKQLGRRIKQIKPLKDSTRTLHIPPRRFLSTVFKDPKVLQKIRRIWEKAVAQTFKDEMAGAPPGPGKVSKPASGGGSSGGGDETNAGGQKRSKPKKAPADRSAAARKGWVTRRAKAAKAAK